MAVYAEEMCSRLVPHLINSGAQVAVALRADAGNCIKNIEATGAEIICLDPSSTSAPRKLLEYYYRVSQTARRFDLIHSLDHKIPWWEKTPSLSMTIHDCCYLETPQEYTFAKRVFVLKTQRWATRVANDVVTVSNTARRALIQRLGVAPDKVSVIYNGCDLTQFRSEPSAEDGRFLQAHGIEPGYFLFVGRVSPRKNLHLVISAMRALAQEGGAVRKVALVGPEGWRNSDDFAMLAQSEVSHHFFSVGFVGRPTLAALYRNATALLFPSLCEGFGLPVLEALACGCPAVVTAGTASHEIGHPHVLTVDGRSSAEMVDVIRRLTDSQVPRENSALVSRHLARFSWDRAAAELHTLLSRRIS
jgi:alpha-1,3-rhamnosyl/mannosyltransferase